MRSAAGRPGQRHRPVHDAARASASRGGPGGSTPRRHSCWRARSGSTPASRSCSTRSPTAHWARLSISTGSPSSTGSSSWARATSSRARRKSRTGCLRNDARSSSETSPRVRRARGSGPVRNGAGAVRGPAAARAPASAVRSKVNGVPGHERAGRDVAGVERLQRVPDGDGVGHADRARVGGRVEGVEQLAERYGGRARLAGVLVGAGVGDDQRLGRGQHRVEQQLAVLAAGVALAGARVAGQHVVAVDRADPREDAVVEAEQADHAVRHRAHRHHRADGERAGAEVGAGRPAGEPVGEQGADVGQPQRRSPPRPPAASAHPAELALHLAGLPGLARRGRAVSEPIPPAERPSSQWSSGWVPTRSSVTARSRSTYSASRPTRSTCPLPTSSSGSVRSSQAPESSDIATPASSRSRPNRQVFCTKSASPKSARCSASKAQRTPASRTQVVSCWRSSSEKPNRTPDRLGVGEVEHVAGAGAAAGQVEQPGGHVEQRVGLGRARGRPAGPAAGGPGGRRRRPPRRARSRPRSAARRSRCRGTSRARRAARGSGRRRAARAAPRAARRPGGPRRGRRAPGPSGRRRAAAAPTRRRPRWRAGRPGASPAGSRAPSARRPGRSGARRRTVARVRWSSRTSRPSVESSGWPTRWWRGVVGAQHRPAGGLVGQRTPQRVARPSVDSRGWPTRWCVVSSVRSTGPPAASSASARHSASEFPGGLTVLNRISRARTSAVSSSSAAMWPRC